MTSKNLILHIGTHKSGSTTIQNALYAARTYMLSRGYLYGATDRSPFPKLAKHTSTFAAINGSVPQQEFEAGEIIREFDESGCHTLILSEEGFSNMNFDCSGYFREHFGDFTIRTVVFLRRPDFFVESLWNQFVGHRKDSRSIKQFARSDDIQARLNYVALLERWEKLGEVCVGNFEDAKTAGLESEFCRLARTPEIPRLNRSNVSPGMNAAAMMALLNRMGVEYSEATISRLFAGRDVRKYALGSMERKRIMSSFKDDFLFLKDRYGIVFDSTLPSEGVFSLRFPTIKSLLFASLNALKRHD